MRKAYPAEISAARRHEWMLASRPVTVARRPGCWCGLDPCPYAGVRHPNFMLVTGPSGFPDSQRLPLRKGR